jgi:integrase/recombinase XerD
VLSPNTLIAYEHDLKLWIKYAGEVDVSQVTNQDLRAFLAWLHTDYKPHRFSGSEHPLAAKTVHNVWITLSSFFTWATAEFEMPNPMKAIAAPHFEKAPVEPFSKDDVDALLKACEFSREANTIERRRFRMRRVTANRDRAIILFLLDTGLRASELCSLKIEDVDQNRFRHTFAITCLRSGGDVFTLQSLLGHSALDMVQHYARIAEVDIQEAHRRATPKASG